MIDKPTLTLATSRDYRTNNSISRPAYSASFT